MNASLVAPFLLSVVLAGCGSRSPQPLTVTPVGNASLVGVPGQSVALAVDTDKNANCDIVVLYASGPSRSAGLVPEHADPEGRVSWTWTIDANAPLGEHPLFVRCHRGSAEAGVDGTLTVN